MRGDCEGEKIDDCLFLGLLRMNIVDGILRKISFWFGRYGRIFFECIKILRN